MPVVNSEENRLLLAKRVVDEADMDETIEMAIAGCYDLYQRDEAKFHEDWDSVFGERG